MDAIAWIWIVLSSVGLIAYATLDVEEDAEPAHDVLVVAHVGHGQEWFLFYEVGDEDAAVGCVCRWVVNAGLDRDVAKRMIDEIWKGTDGNRADREAAHQLGLE